jgi:hypothetical protein
LNIVIIRAPPTPQHVQQPGWVTITPRGNNHVYLAHTPSLALSPITCVRPSSTSDLDLNQPTLYDQLTLGFSTLIHLFVLPHSNRSNNGHQSLVRGTLLLDTKLGSRLDFEIRINASSSDRVCHLSTAQPTTPCLHPAWRQTTSPWCWMRRPVFLKSMSVKAECVVCGRRGRTTRAASGVSRAVACRPNDLH